MKIAVAPTCNWVTVSDGTDVEQTVTRTPRSASL
jgi:hypothetical protein